MRPSLSSNSLLSLNSLLFFSFSWCWWWA